MSWYAGLEEICRVEVPLAEHTWYGLGGPARWLLTPRSEDDLARVLRQCADAGVPWRVLGAGANVLARDEGFDGAVIHLDGPFWEEIRFEGATVEARAGADFTHLVRHSIEQGLVGLEALAGIPGTLGGAVRMNAGGRHGSLSQFIRTVRLMRADGSIEERTAEQAGFGYRTSRLDGGIVLSATLQLEAGDREAALARFRDIWNEKYASQPAVAVRSAGCIFKNPPGQAAGALIDRAGLKGRRSGGAEISTKHANFIVAHPGAKSSDVLELITLAQSRVLEESGVKLELEVDVW